MNKGDEIQQRDIQPQHWHRFSLFLLIGSAMDFSKESGMNTVTSVL